MLSVGKREGLVYLTVFLWIIMGAFGSFKGASLTDLSIYFGSLTAYVATYVWAETKKPSEKTGLTQRGPNSRREMMIYIVVTLWAIAGAIAIWYQSDLNELSIYFVSLTGFVASWIAGEVYKPEDQVKKQIKNG